MSALGHERFFSAANRSQHVRHGARTDRRCAQEMRHSCGHARLSEGRSGISAAPQPRMAVTPRRGAQPAPQPRRRGRTELGESRRRVYASGAIRRGARALPAPSHYVRRSPSLPIAVRCHPPGPTCRPSPPSPRSRGLLDTPSSSIPPSSPRRLRGSVRRRPPPAAPREAARSGAERR